MSDCSDPYDAMPYESRAHPQAHPDNMAVIASLFGMQPPTLAGARVLEIGCAAGGHLLPLAAAYPGSHFVGIDLSSGQITEAREGAAALRLDNTVFHAMGLGEVGTAFGTFDYIVAHGVYSWVPAPVREQLMVLVSRLLNPAGVAYVSFNTLPGSSTRAALRDMVKFHTRQAGEAVDRVAGARAFFTFMEEALQDRGDPYAQALSEELSQVAELGDFYIAHEHLEQTNDPCYFHEFMSHAKRHGLQFLGEADLRSMSSAGFPASVRTRLRYMAAAIEDAEQYGDFVRNRAFRQTLLCRAGVALNRRISPDRVQPLRVASCLDSEVAEGGASVRFRDADGRVLEVRDDLTAAALQELRVVWPKALPFGELLAKASARLAVPSDARGAAALAHGLLTCYVSSPGMEFQLQPRPFRDSVSGFPEVSPLARWQAVRGLRVTNQRHENVLLRPEEQAVLLKLDGQSALGELLQEFPEVGPLLEYFARIALLVS